MYDQMSIFILRLNNILDHAVQECDFGWEFYLIGHCHKDTAQIPISDPVKLVIDGMLFVC